MLRLHDTAERRVRPLELRQPGEVSMYVCGPTVYDLPHLGHGHHNLVFDVLRRYLHFRGFDVRYVSNVTDVDDHIIERAEKEGRSEPEVATRFEAEWFAAMDALGVWRPDDTPHATGWIGQMVELVSQLVERGTAYETSDGVYLSVGDVPGYGLLKHQPLESLQSGARVEVNPEKRSPLDFALWKKAKPGEPTWPSPWGEGRPGWHTECVAMSLGLLGDGFDLHGGGEDLVFPHHENERAQAVALGRPFAQHWVHHGFVTTAGEKMSKSLANFTTISDLLAAYDPRSYRLLVLRSHYRSPLEVTPDSLRQADEGLSRLDALARRFSLPDPLADGPVRAPFPHLPSTRSASTEPDAGSSVVTDPEVADALQAFVERMDDDLDSPAALAGIFDLVRRANAAADAGDPERGAVLAELVALLCGAVGLPLRGGEAEVDPRSAELVRLRDQARAARDWAEADRLRGELRALGWTVEDGPEGTRLHR